MPSKAPEWRLERAWELRREGVTLKEIGKLIGRADRHEIPVSRLRARQMIDQWARIRVSRGLGILRETFPGKGPWAGSRTSKDEKTGEN